MLATVRQGVACEVCDLRSESQAEVADGVDDSWKHVVRDEGHPGLKEVLVKDRGPYPLNWNLKEIALAVVVHEGEGNGPALAG